MADPSLSSLNEPSLISKSDQPISFSSTQNNSTNLPNQELAVFQLSIFIPRPKFCPGVTLIPILQTSQDHDPESPYVELNLPAHGPETIRELQQSVIESVEGWWLGSFGLASVELDKAGNPDQSQLHIRTIYGEFAELSSAFRSPKFQDSDVKRALLAVDVDYTEYTARLHVIRMRDVLYSQSPGLLVGSSTPFPAYDPSQIGIDGAITLFSQVRGNSSNSPDHHSPPQLETVKMALNKPKKKKKNASPPPHMPQPSQSAPESTSQESAMAHLANYNFTPSKPFAAFDSLRKDLSEAHLQNSATLYLKSFALSNWNSPPHHYRLRGHYLYLAITTLENLSYEITCHSQGFYVNKSSASHFDPSPSGHSSDHSIYFHALSHLLCSLSPLFAKHVAEVWSRALSPVFPDFFSSISITNCLPAFPWLVNPEKPSPDAIRSQLAYLITGSTTAETLPPARDWADELAQARELPRKTLAERTLRERIWSRLQSDFSLAATRGVISCSRGEVPPLNPQEPESAWTYVLNNILFSRAEDPIGAYAHLGGTAAARAIASKDLDSIKHLNQLDVPGIFTMGSAVIDYHGKRWIAQGMIPGIFRPPDLEAEKSQQDLAAKRVASNQSSTFDEKDESDWEKVNCSLPATPKIPMTTPDDDFLTPATYDILYGSADIEKPEMGLRSDPKFHRLAANVASGFNLTEHTVKDINGREHLLWLSADVHGIRATDGRCYLIDLYRMTPLDIEFIENDFDGPILDGKTSPPGLSATKSQSKPTSDCFPHRFTVIRMEAIASFKQYKLRQFAIQHLHKYKQHQQTSQSNANAENLKQSSHALKEGPGDELVADPNKIPGDIPEPDQRSFKFGLDPDVFVDRKDQPWNVPRDQEDEAMALVRELSNFVRGQLLSNVVQDLSEVKGLPADGRRLSDLLHSHGVNIRYLGHITHRLQLASNALSTSTENDGDQEVVLQASIGLLQSEMVFRACKHILNQMLLDTSEAEACHCISHFLNCLLSHTPASPSSEPHLDLSAAWRSCSRQSLRTRIITEIRHRFRYTLPTSFFTQRLPQTKIQMLREICTRMGVQLLLRDYDLSYSSSEKQSNNGLTQTTKDLALQKNLDTVQITDENISVVNAQLNITDSDEHSTEGSPLNGLAANSSTPKPSKKKKKSKSKKASNGSTLEGQIFSPDDILNLVPIVRDSTCRSSVADELYAEGRKAFATGEVALGQELCTDALTTYEQVFGSIHPEMCRHWHSLAILYHQLSQRALVELSEYNDRLLELSAMYHATDNENERENIKQKIESCQRDREPESVKNEIDTFIQLAANNLRQSVIVAERTLGLDHPETIQQYSDLSVMEYHLGNTDTAMRYTKHALDLWHLVYGPGCHPDASASVTHAGVLAQSTSDPNKSPKADSIFGLSQRLIGSFFGTESGKFGEATLILSQMYSQSGKKELAIQYGLEAKQIYLNKFGESDEKTKYVNQLYDSIFRSIQVQIKGDEDKFNRLAKRLGFDPKRAASLRARLAASSPTHDATITTRAQGSSSTKGSLNHKDTIPPQNNGAVSIDELVKYIQGGSSSGVNPTNPSPTATDKFSSAKSSARTG